jgi:hypothetical protein
MSSAAARGMLVVLIAAIGGCAASEPPARDRNLYCAQLFDQLDGYDWLPVPTVGFDFRHMQLARIRQARCVTFTRELEAMATVPEAAPRPADPAAPFPRPRAVQAGIVTNAADAERARTFFAANGFRTRTVGYAGLGTRVYVEARSPSEAQATVVLARQAGFVGPYLSRYALF